MVSNPLFPHPKETSVNLDELALPYSQLMNESLAIRATVRGACFMFLGVCALAFALVYILTNGEVTAYPRSLIGVAATVLLIALLEVISAFVKGPRTLAPRLAYALFLLCFVFMLSSVVDQDSTLVAMFAVAVLGFGTWIYIKDSYFRPATRKLDAGDSSPYMYANGSAYANPRRSRRKHRKNKFRK